MVIFAVTAYPLSLINVNAQGPILTVRLLDRTYDVYNIAPQLIEIRGLNNRRPSDDAAALAVGEFSSSDIYKHAAFYSPHAGLWYLHTNVNNSMDTFAEDGGVADVGTMQAHTIDYDPHDDVFIFVTTLESGYRTWAYRPR